MKYNNDNLCSMLESLGLVFDFGGSILDLVDPFLIFWAPFWIFGLLFRPSEMP